MYEQPTWGTVDLGVDVLQGHGEQSQPGQRDFYKNHPGSKTKEQYNPGRNQELNLPPESFPMIKGERVNPFSPSGKVIPLEQGERVTPTDSREPVKNIHERIKELLGEGMPRKFAVAKAKDEAQKEGHGDVGTITQKEVMQKKYQAETPWKKISPFSEQVQGYPFI